MPSLGSLVIELAANTARLQGDLGKATSMLQSFASKAKTAFGALGVGSAGGLLGGIVRNAIELGDELQKGAQRAGVAASTFSQLAAAAKQSDVDIGTLSKGLKAMQVAISTAGQGGKEAAAAFRQLGLNIDELRNLRPDEQFKAIASALQRVPDASERARLGSAALSKAYLELVPLLDQGADGISALVEEQKKLGNTFTDEQIKALADTDDAIKRLKSSWEGFATTLTAAVAPAISTTLDRLTQLTKAAKDRPVSTSVNAGLLFNPITAPFAAGNLLAGSAPQSAPLRTHNRGLNFSAEIAEQRRLDEATREEREKNAKEEATKLAKTQDEINKYVFTEQAKVYEDLTKATNDLIEEQSNFLGGSKQVFEEYMDGLSRYTRQSTTELSVYAEEAARNIQDAFADFLFDPFKDGLKGLLRNFIDVLRRMVAEAAAAKIFDALTAKYGKGSGTSGAGNILTSVLGAVFGGARAGGGPVSAGKAYLVGERGPEMFIPSGSGSIAANGSGSVTMNNYYDLRGSTADAMAALPALLDRRDAALKADIISGIQRKKYPISRG